jgi:hypothetical protein
MEVTTKYRVYTYNNIVGNEDYKALSEVEFNGMVFNSFESEEEAIGALINDDKTFKQYVILKEIYITNYRI